MSELVIRAGHNDHRVLEELLTDPTAVPARSARHVRRVAVEAVAAASTDVYDRAARASGTQLVIDPMTHLLVSAQDPDDAWARLPFTGGPRAWQPRELADPAARAQLIEEVVEFELDHGATAIVPPYLHLNDLGGTAAGVTQCLARETGHYLRNDLGLDMPVLPILSIDRTAVPLDLPTWNLAMRPLLRTMSRAADGEAFALGLSGSTGNNATNLHARARIWRRTSRVGPFIAWNAGDAGLLAVTMGATGYASGLCRAERYDVRSQASNRAPDSGGPGPRHTGAYVDVLGRSFTLSSLRALAAQGGPVRGDITCTDIGCCPNGTDSMLGPAGRRQHAARRRLAELEVLDGISARGWRLHHLHARAEDASHAAARIRRAADRLGLRVGVYPREYEDMARLVLGLRETARAAATAS